MIKSEQVQNFINLIKQNNHDHSKVKNNSYRKIDTECPEEIQSNSRSPHQIMGRLLINNPKKHFIRNSFKKPSTQFKDSAKKSACFEAWVDLSSEKKMNFYDVYKKGIMKKHQQRELKQVYLSDESLKEQNSQRISEMMENSQRETNFPFKKLTRQKHRQKTQLISTLEEDNEETTKLSKSNQKEEKSFFRIKKYSLNNPTVNSIEIDKLKKQYGKLHTQPSDDKSGNKLQINKKKQKLLNGFKSPKRSTINIIWNEKIEGWGSNSSIFHEYDLE